MAEKSYYVRDRGKVRGPFDLAGLRALRDRGQFSSFHEISEDRRVWTTASALTELFAPSGQGASVYPVAEVVRPAVPTRRDISGADLDRDDGQSSRRGRAKMECPRCASRNVQSFEVIYEMGTAHTESNSVGFAPGVGMVFGATSGTHRTRAALNAAPPSRRDSTGPVLAIILGAAIIFGAALIMTAGLGSGDRHGDSFAPLLFLFLVILFVGVLILIAGISSARSANRWNSYQYPQLYDTWLRSFRCLQCGHEFALR
jgi:hypothetical protein